MNYSVIDIQGHVVDVVVWNGDDDVWNVNRVYGDDFTIRPSRIDDVIFEIVKEIDVIPDVTKRQILVWLYQNLGKADTDVQTAIQSIPDSDASAIAMITWLNPDGPFSRSDPLFDELAPIFGMTSEQVDAAFVAASAL